jgi:hypothetical protein
MLVGAQTAGPRVFPVEWLLNIGGRVLAISDVIAQIDAEILKLQQAKALLSGSTAPASTAPVAAPVKSGRGRPKGSKNSTKAVAAKVVEAKSPAPTKTAKRKLSPEGRKAIADAMKRRWAERRKAAAK